MFTIRHPPSLDMSIVTWFLSREKNKPAGGNSHIKVTGMLVENTPKRYQNLVLCACPNFISILKGYQINNNKWVIPENIHTLPRVA